MSDELQPTSGIEWRKNREQGEMIRLPSGHVVRGRTVLPYHILQLGGDVPDMLTSLALKLFYGKARDADIGDFLNISEEQGHAIKVAQSLQIVTRAFVISPRIVDEPSSDDEISIDDIEPHDQSFIFDVAFRGAKWLSTFSEQQSKQDSDLEAVPEGETILQTTE